LVPGQGKVNGGVHGPAVVQGELHNGLGGAGGVGDRRIDDVLGVADVAARHRQDVALTGDAHGLAGAAQGVEHLGGDHRDVGLMQVDKLSLAVVDLLEDGVTGSVRLGGRAAGAALG